MVNTVKCHIFHAAETLPCFDRNPPTHPGDLGGASHSPQQPPAVRAPRGAHGAGRQGGPGTAAAAAAGGVVTWKCRMGFQWKAPCGILTLTYNQRINLGIQWDERIYIYIYMCEYIIHDDM